LAKLGQFEARREAVEAGLALALEHNLTGPASEVYYRLGAVLEHTAHYPASRDAYLTAIDYCEQHGASAMGQLCMGCVAGALWQTGEWEQAMTLCREVMAGADAPPLIRAIAVAYLGIIHTFRSETKRGSKLLLEAIPQLELHEAKASTIIFHGGLAVIDELDAAYDSSVERYRQILDIWRETEERHYIVFVLRWAVTFFASRGIEQDTRACIEALSKIATGTSSTEALAALAYALRKAALLENDAKQATQQFGQALGLLSKFESPLQEAETQDRAGAALVAAGKREAVVEHLVNTQGSRPISSCEQHFR
jgi:tetratricopeptide (TPR) repeat protein